MDDLNTKISEARTLAEKYGTETLRDNLASLVEERAERQRKKRRLNPPAAPRALAAPQPAKPLQDQLEDAEKLLTAAQDDAVLNNEKLAKAEARVVRVLPGADAEVSHKLLIISSCIENEADKQLKQTAAACQQSLAARNRTKKTADENLEKAKAEVALLKSKIEAAAPIADPNPSGSPTHRSQEQSAQPSNPGSPAQPSQQPATTGSPFQHSERSAPQPATETTARAASPAIGTSSGKGKGKAVQITDAETTAEEARQLELDLE